MPVSRHRFNADQGNKCATTVGQTQHIWTFWVALVKDSPSLERSWCFNLQTSTLSTFGNWQKWFLVPCIWIYLVLSKAICFDSKFHMHTSFLKHMYLTAWIRFSAFSVRVELSYPSQSWYHKWLVQFDFYWKPDIAFPSKIKSCRSWGGHLKLCFLFFTFATITEYNEP